MALTFLSAELITGELREELPISIDSDVSRFLGDVGEGSLLLPIHDPACPDDWLEHTRPWRTLIAAVDERGQVIWAGVPNDRYRDPLSGNVVLPCITVEGYLDRRYVPTLTFTAADQAADIARALAGIAGDAVGIGLDYDTPHTGVMRDRSYYNDEGASVLERVQQLSDVIDGFEWTIDVDWADPNQTAFTKTFRTGYPHLGRVTNAPNAVFELPGSITEAEYTEGWGRDSGATHVTAVGDGEGESKTMSTPVIDTTREAAGWPRLEYRRSFSSVTNQATINAHAESVAAEMFGGQELVRITTRADAAPRFGEWNLGDSALIEIHTDSVDVSQVWRVVGWYLKDIDGSVEPVIARVRTPIDDDWIWS